MEQTTGGRPALLHTVDRSGLDSSPTGYCALPRRETEGSYTCSAGQSPLMSVASNRRKHEIHDQEAYR